MKQKHEDDFLDSLRFSTICLAEGRAKKMAMENKYRLCIVNGNKGLFHGWIDNGRVILDSQGRINGIVNETIGLVEFEDGSVGQINPTGIRFVDDLVTSTFSKEEESEPLYFSEREKRDGIHSVVEGLASKWEYWAGWAGNHDGRIDDATCCHCGYEHKTVYGGPDQLPRICPGCGSLMKVGGSTV